MDRRKFIFSSFAGAVAARIGGPECEKAGALETASAVNESNKLFSAETVPDLTWSQFHALGFRSPVCGMLHRKSTAAQCGMPIGSIGTGCLDLDTDGTLGYCSIFTSRIPPRGKLNSPVLGLRMEKKAWVLATGHIDEIENVSTARDIHYWGHYPVADLEFDTSAPVSVGLRAWSPFVPGDVALSSTPGAVFDVHIRNTERVSHKGSLVFNFPGPTQAEAQISRKSDRESVRYNWYNVQVPVAKGVTRPKRQTLDGELKGVRVVSDTGMEYTLAAVAKGNVHVNGPLAGVGNAWFASPPDMPEDEFGSSLVVEFDLGPSESTVIHIVLAWYAPLWKGEGDHCFTPMYATRYSDSLAVARLLARDHNAILTRILNWQEAIYTDEWLPVWLREALINNLHLITEVSLWAAATPPLGDWCRPEDGLYGMNESPRDCPQMECIPCSFYGNIPVVYFFPELALSTLRGYKAYQYPDGAAPWIFGGWTGHPRTEGSEMAMPNRGYQTTTNGISYADIVDKYWLRTGDAEFLKEFYPSVKQNMIYTMSLNTGPDRVIRMPNGNIDPANGEHAQEWVEGEKWYGMTSHVGGLHLAQLKIVERMAKEVGDQMFVEQCQGWIREGSESMEGKMWAGDYYLAYFEPETGKRSDRIFSCQLDGDWIASFHGLPHIFREDRAKIARTTIATNNSSLAPCGTVFFSNPDGTPWMEAGYGPFTIFVSEQLMLAMTYIYAGEREFGLDQAYRCFHNLMAKGYTWDQPCVIEAKTGNRIAGFDYYQNLMLWSLPAAIAGKDLRGPCAPSGLVNRVLQAASANASAITGHLP